MLLAGMSFFGDPFHAATGWSIENEIGRLWKRLMPFVQMEAERLAPYQVKPDLFYEVHIETLETASTGEMEVFAGYEVNHLADLWPYLSYKQLPQIAYACFTLKGEQITGDWTELIFEDWLKHSAYENALPYLIERYDSRYKGVDQIDQSELDVLVPVKLKR
jgi:predicted transcriptional regulator YdeE